MNPIIKINNAVDVLEVVPGLLGFYPTESLCAIVLERVEGGAQRIALTARMDLPTTTVDTSQAAEMLAGFAHQYDSLALVAYSVDLEAARQTLRTLVTTIQPGSLLTAIIAAPQGWTHLDPEMPDYVAWMNPYPTSTGHVAAAVAAAGLYAHGTRDDMRDSIAPPDPQSVHAFEQAWVAAQVPDRPTKTEQTKMLTDITTYIAEYLAAPFTVTSEDAAWLVAHIQPLVIRDAVLAQVERETARLHAALWREVVALTPDREAALPALALLAFTGWISGDGIWTNLAVQRAHTIPGAGTCTLIGLADQISQHAIPPQQWDTWRHDLLD